MRATAPLATLILLSSLAAPAAAITINQFDDFQDLTAMGWTKGNASSFPPTVIPNGGPTGAGDAWLQNEAFGGGGPDSKQVLFNNAQWTGDYLAAGVDRIDAMFFNHDDQPMYMRVALEGTSGQRYASTDFFFLPADGAWHAASFDLTAASLTQVGGSDPLNTVLAGVGELRILSRESTPGWRGDAIEATLGIDNITALPEPASLFLIGLAAVCLRRR